MATSGTATTENSGFKWEPWSDPAKPTGHTPKLVPTLIVAIDDDPELLRLISETLTPPEFECQTFLDPHEAIRQLVLCPPGMVIVDFNMPLMSGIELCDEVRQKLGSATPPIIMLSGNEDEANITNAYKSGVRDYLLKPVKPVVLRTKVRNLLSSVVKSQDLIEGSPKSLGRYQIIAEIGRGGMGVVYRVHHPDHVADLALKTFSTSAQDPDGALRFRREIDVMFGLSHPNLLRIYETGKLDKTCFFVMELIEGGSLADRIRRDGAIPPAEVASICFAIGGALGYIHSRKLIHRDIKPGNILLSADRGPILSDFGLSKNVVDRQITASGNVLGTPHFMAPEMIRGEAVDHRADLFALGMVALEMLRGGVIIDETNPYRVMQRIITRDFPLASEIITRTPASHILLHAIDQLLALNPDRRFPSAQAFCQKIEPILERHRS